MKIRSERDKRNYIIVALCAILVVMGVGYAAFSSLLTINGTANISNSWCVGFDSTKSDAMTPTKGLSTGTQPTGTMEFTGTACEANYKPNANLQAHFYQPGDQIEYTLTITNKSSVTAAIKSFTINGEENVTSNWSHTDGNITYKVNMPSDTTLSPDEEVEMTVIAKFQNETPVTGNVNGETKTLSVSIDVQQDDGNGGFTPAPSTYTGDVYAWNTTSVTIGTSRINDLASTKTAQPYYSSAADVMSASGYTFFNMYTVENDILTEGYSCQTFGISGFEPVCLKMSTDGSGYGYDAGGNHTGNAGILNALNSNTAFTGNNPAGSCGLGWYDSYCGAGYLDVYADSSGYVSADDNSTHASCYVGTDGSAGCGG